MYNITEKIKEMSKLNSDSKFIQLQDYEKNLKKYYDEHKDSITNDEYIELLDKISDINKVNLNGQSIIVAITTSAFYSFFIDSKISFIIDKGVLYLFLSFIVLALISILVGRILYFGLTIHRNKFYGNEYKDRYFTEIHKRIILEIIKEKGLNLTNLDDSHY